MRTLKKARSLFMACAAIAIFLILLPGVWAQETTAALQGTVKDASGALVAHATVTLTSPTLAGGKTAETDGKGYYHFSNLPPGAYLITASGKGFSTIKRDGVVLEVGHAPSIDLTLAVGAESTVVEVSSAAPAIDVTSTTTQTNVTQDVIDYVPRGRSFQSVIQFAPSARNEPLMGNTTTNGSGSVSPGNGSNGSPYGYSVAGGSDSENSYLVEGQETANLIGGYSHTNVPFDFIQEVQVKTSGVAAQYGGALGGVVDVIMKKGTSHYHGTIFASFENQAFDASPNALLQYNQLSAPTAQPNWQSAVAPTDCTGATPGAYCGASDAQAQIYNPVKPKTSNVFPGFTFGGPLLPMFSGLRDKIFGFIAFNPDLVRYETKVNYGAANGGIVPYSQNTNTYYTTARIDAQATKRIRVFGSWLYQLQRQNGESLPTLDSTEGYFNPSTGCFGAATGSSAATQCQSAGSPKFSYGHGLGYVAPNTTVNTGADITITPSIVSTTHFGYYFENYHDFGYPTTGVLNYFNTSGIGATDTNGNPLPANLQQSLGYQSGPLDQNFTQHNASKAIQLDQDIAIFKSTSFGTHNFKFGYQLVRNSNTLNQHYNEPLVNVQVGTGGAAIYQTSSSVGQANCQNAVVAAGGSVTVSSSGTVYCQGQYGYVTIEDFGTNGNAISYDHGLYGQDSWTLGRGITIDFGIRADKEYLPGEAQGATTSTGASLAKPINFGFRDKFAPRVGFAWDVMRDGKMKVFGSYGVFYDTMKLNLAISSFGGQYWQNCNFALNTPNLASINPTFNSNGRYCSGSAPNSTTNFGGSTAPAGLTFIESQDFRAFPTTCSTCSAQQEGVAPHLKPYEQHEAVAGFDYQISRNIAFEARYDRRRLDHVIEDSSLASAVTGSETFVVVNPGQGVNASFSDFCNFLYGSGAPDCQSSNGTNPPDQTIPAARSYDGLEFRLNKALSNHWFGLFSYTYSHFRGNYTGLTSSDLADGGSGGRNAPNNSRSFDEPYFQYNAFGGSSSGLLPTDRPNTFKGYAYYRLGFLKRFTTDLGIFQTAYQGSPNTSYLDVGYSESAFPVDIFNRGMWADVSQNQSTGAITVGTPHVYRNPWYTQTDFNLNQGYKVTEGKTITFSATFSNILNQHAVTAVNEQIDSPYGGGSANQFATPGGFPFYAGVPFYAAAEHPYSVPGVLNGNGGGGNSDGGPLTISSLYGKPLYYQQPRTIRIGLNFAF